MKKSSMIVRTIAPAFLILCSFTVRATESELAAFVNTPTLVTYQALAQRIHECGTTCCFSAYQARRLLIKLEHLVEANNTLAVDIAFSIRELLDGGELQDLTRSLGLQVESNPPLFLRNVKKRDISGNQLRRLVGALPESTVDDMGLKALRIRERMGRLSEVTDPSLADVRDEALRMLGQLLSDIRRHCEDAAVRMTCDGVK